jgi:hypothetical protein
MSFDDLSLDGSEVGSSPEAPSEKSEKQKETSRRAQAQLQKTQKDEKKAKSDNDDLFDLLSRFIQNPLYEDIIPTVVLLLQNAYPSRFILVSIALIYPEASYYLFQKLQKSIPHNIYTQMHHYEKAHPFHNDDMHPSIRDWVTLWMSSSQEFLTTEDSSVVLMQKLIHLLSESPTRRVAHVGISEIFRFFFLERNVIIDKPKADAYAEFIIIQLENSLNLSLESTDKDLRTGEVLDTNSLFGI